MGNGVDLKKPQLALFLLLALAAAQPGLPLEAKWGIVTPPDLDPRLSPQLSQLAAKNKAELVTLANAHEAKSRRVTTLIELVQSKGGVESLLATLKRHSGPAGLRLTQELAAQGYVIEITYSGRSSKPRRIHVTAATPEGFHNALVRVADLERVWPASLATE